MQKINNDRSVLFTKKYIFYRMYEELLDTSMKSYYTAKV